MLSIGADPVIIDPQPPVHGASAHLERMNVSSARQPISVAGLDAYEEPALAARAHRHVAVDEERKTAEHALLGQPAFVREQAPHPVGKIFVKRNSRSEGRAKSGCAEPIVCPQRPIPGSMIGITSR